MKDGDLFWVAELVDPNTMGPFAPALYWNGHTRPGFDAVTTTDMHEAWKFRTPEACQESINKLAPCKRGVLTPIEHAWVQESADA